LFTLTDLETEQKKTPVKKAKPFSEILYEKWMDQPRLLLKLSLFSVLLGSNIFCQQTAENLWESERINYVRMWQLCGHHEH
jgi:hypothetical protein